MNVSICRTTKTSVNLLNESKRETGLQQETWSGGSLDFRMGAMIEVF